MAQLLLRENCTVTVTHSKTQDLVSHVKQADIVTAAIGRPGFVKQEWLKPGAIVLDVGISRGEGDKVLGDVEPVQQGQRSSLKAYSPVPGGVGPMTVACLLFNTVLATLRQHNIAPKYLPLYPIQEGWCPTT